MSANPSQRSPFKWVFPSQETTPLRSLSERLLGLGIFLFLALLICLLQIQKGEAYRSEWSPLLFTIHPIGWAIFYCLLNLSAWLLWCRFHLQSLKIETLLFLLQFLWPLLGEWSARFFQEDLLALLALLLLGGNHLLTTLLFWKREPFAARLLWVAAVWIVYEVFFHMGLCLYPS